MPTSARAGTLILLQTISIRALRRGDGTSRTPSPTGRGWKRTPCRGRRPRRPAADTIVYRFCLRNSRRDEGIAPYARFRIERNIFPLLRRAGCPHPAAGTSIILQTTPKRALRRGGERIATAAGRPRNDTEGSRCCGAGTGRRGRRPLQAEVGSAHLVGGGVPDAPLLALSVLRPEFAAR